MLHIMKSMKTWLAVNIMSILPCLMVCFFFVFVLSKRKKGESNTKFEQSPVIWVKEK